MDNFDEFPAQQTGNDEKPGREEPARTVEFWRKNLQGLDKKIFELVIVEHQFDERDRITKSHLNKLISNIANRKII